MKNDKLKVGNIVWYKDYRVHFCIVKKTKGNNVIISEEIYNHPLFKRRVKKNDVQKIPKVYVKISNAQMDEIGKHCGDRIDSFLPFKKTKQVWRLCYMKNEYIAVMFYSPNKRRKLFCISPSEDIFIEQKFIAIYL